MSRRPADTIPDARRAQQEALSPRGRPLRSLLLLGTFLLAGCASVPAGTLESGAASVEVPAGFVGAHVLVGGQIAAGPVQLILDTGAEMTLLNLSAARALGVEMRGESVVTGTGPDTILGGITAEEIAIGTVGSEPYFLRRPVADLSMLEAAFGGPLGGFLGGDLFLRFVVEFDYADERVILHDPRQFRPNPADVGLPLEIIRQRPFVRGDIVLPDGREISGRFLIDTGSGRALSFNSPFVRRHGIPEAMPSVIESAAMGVGGQSISSEGRLRSFRIGPFTLTEPIATLSVSATGMSASEQSVGHIGGEILQRFNLTVDYRSKVLYLRPNSNIDDPFEANMAGFGLLAGGADFRTYRVDRVAARSPAERAGLSAGDVLVEVNGRPAEEFTMQELRDLSRSEPGDLLELVVKRDGESHDLQIQLERRI